jgi:cell division protein ZapA (FtsZ GTPase activity inhibitor)
MPALYQIADEVRRLMDGLDCETGELTEQDAAQLTAMEMAFEKKAEHVALYVREIESEADGIEEEAKRLAAMVRTRRNRSASLKGYLLSCMKALGQLKIKGALCTVAVQNSPQCVNVTDAKIIPASYWQPADPILNKSVLLADMKAGQVVPGAEIAQGQHLRIR